MEVWRSSAFRGRLEAAQGLDRESAQATGARQSPVDAPLSCLAGCEYLRSLCGPSVPPIGDAINATINAIRKEAVEKYKAEQEQNAPDHSQGPAVVTFRAPPTPQPAPTLPRRAVASSPALSAPYDGNFERAREAVAEWPAWKREHTLTKHSEGVALQAPAKGVGSTDTLQTTATMSSREIAELVDKRHDNVKRTIQMLGERGVLGSPQFEEYLDSLGRKATEYSLGKSDSFVVVAQLSPEFTGRVVDRWQELEEQVAAKPAQPVVSKDPLDLLMLQAQMFPQLIAEMQEQKRVAEGQARALEAQAEKLEAVQVLPECAKSHNKTIDRILVSVLDDSL